MCARCAMPVAVTALTRRVVSFPVKRKYTGCFSHFEIGDTLTRPPATPVFFLAWKVVGTSLDILRLYTNSATVQPAAGKAHKSVLGNFRGFEDSEISLKIILTKI